MAKNKQIEIDKWVRKYLTETKNSTELKLDRIPWICPKCSKKFKMIPPFNKYIASYLFECDECGAKHRHRDLHFYVN